MSDYTVIITASVIPSHPSIEIIGQTIESLKLISEEQKFPIILAHDFSESLKYQKYLENLQNYTSNNERIQIKVRKTHGHLVGNIKNVIDLVKTKYLFIIQHDLPFIRGFETNKIIEDMIDYPQIKHLRFNHRKNKKRGWDSISDIFGLQIQAKNYSYTRTPCWSDRNHLCLTSYYKDIVLKESKDGTFMENTLSNQPKSQESHEKYGTYLFGAYKESPTIKHTHGRKFNLNN